MIIMKAFMSHIATYIVYPLLERYLKRDVRSKITTLKRYYSQNFEERKRYQKQALIRNLEAAGQNVPYYRDLFRKIQFSPKKVQKDIKYLQDVPFLTKKIIQENKDRMLNENLDKEKLVVAKTGGSTGPSTMVYYSQEAVDWTSATNQVVLQWAGRKRYMKELHLASRFPEVFPLKDRIKEHIKCFAMNRSNIFTHSFDDEDLLSIWKILRKRRPYLLQGHPSTMYALANFINKQKLAAEQVIHIFESTGEVLDFRKRALIEKVFRCRCVDRYGNAEIGVIAYETDYDKHLLKVTDYMVYPESIAVENNSMQEAKNNSMQEIVVTSLTNDAMPFIRYKTGDLGLLSENQDGYFYFDIQGRIHDHVKINGKTYPTHYIQDLLDRIGGIEEFQVEQHAVSKILLRIVPCPWANTEDIDRRLNSWWGDSVNTEFTDYNGLKRSGWRGKFQYLV